MTRRLIVLSVGIVFAAALALEAGQFDPRVRAKLEESRAAYRTLDALHVKVSWTARYTGSMSRDDFPLPGPDTLELRMQRPNKVYLAASSRTGERPSSYLIVSDGESLWHWRSVPNTYTQVKAPASLKELPRALPENAIGTYDGTTWTLDTILEWDALMLDEDLFKDMSEVGLIGSLTTEKLGNEVVDVLKLRLPGASSPIPISHETTFYLSATNHLVRECRISVRGKNPDNGRDFTTEMRGVYDVHNAQPKFTPADFQFTPPRGSKLVKGKDAERR
jgi:hypothetical protein